MTDPLIVAIDVIAATFFLLAVFWAYHNYKEEVAISDFWIVYAVAALFGTMFMMIRAAEWAGIEPVLLDDIQPFFAIVGITMLVTTGIVCALSPIERQIKSQPLDAAGSWLVTGAIAQKIVHRVL